MAWASLGGITEGRNGELYFVVLDIKIGGSIKTLNRVTSGQRKTYASIMKQCSKAGVSLHDDTT